MENIIAEIDESIYNCYKEFENKVNQRIELINIFLFNNFSITFEELDDYCIYPVYIGRLIFIINKIETMQSGLKFIGFSYLFKTVT